eukprot:gene22355-45764_t
MAGQGTNNNINNGQNGQHLHTPGPVTKRPTQWPTSPPTRFPTSRPTMSPTEWPTAFPTRSPRMSPPTPHPSGRPSSEPTQAPTLVPNCQDLYCRIFSKDSTCRNHPTERTCTDGADVPDEANPVAKMPIVCGTEDACVKGQAWWTRCFDAYCMRLDPQSTCSVDTEGLDWCIPADPGKSPTEWEEWVIGDTVYPGPDDDGDSSSFPFNKHPIQCTVWVGGWGWGLVKEWWQIALIAGGGLICAEWAAFFGGTQGWASARAYKRKVLGEDAAVPPAPGGSNPSATSAGSAVQ